MPRPESDARVIATMRPAVDRGARYSGHELYRKTLDVRGDRGHEDAVVEPSHPTECANQLAGIGLAAARDARNQREEAKAYPH